MAPTTTAGERARRYQTAPARWLRSLVIASSSLVLISAIAARPRPGFEGTGLGVALALLGCLLGTAGVLRDWWGWTDGRRAIPVVLLALSAAGLDWLQPGGQGLLAAFVAACVAAMRLRGRWSVAVATLTAGSVVLAQTQAPEPSFSSVVAPALGVIAFYVIALLAQQWRAGQEQTEALLAELEETRAAQAQAAVLAERTRLAREMHDVLAHSLSGLLLQLAGARLLIAQTGADAEVVDAVDRAHHLARAGLEEARRAIGLLREDALPGPERLAALAGEFERDTGVPCRVEVGGEPRPLEADVRLTLYRVAQEALTNVRKHARANQVMVCLVYEPEGIRLVVEDTGTGDAAVSESGGYGLTGMRERAALLGGTLSAGPTDAGFRVELWVPV
ncbi:MAG TPA: sensor histidine kinase [Dehalococcoidia bacterium]|jgi:signal transduction histidine kinase